MAYDEDLAARIRDELAPVPDVGEIKMFGGLCFTIGGNMCVGIVRDDLMVRVAPVEYDALLREPGARVMDFNGRPMKGFLFVDGPTVRSAADLSTWVGRASDYVREMPPKRRKDARAKT